MTGYYTDNSDKLFQVYESVSPVDLYPFHLPYVMARRGGVALDVGAGSGRDAAWLADLGYQVTAAEPNDAMRAGAQRLHGGDRAIVWSSAALPDLEGLDVPSEGYDIVVCNGVFMHVHPDMRQAAVARLAAVVSKTGVICLNFRAVTPADEVRAMYPIHADEIAGHATALGLAFENAATDDVLGRSQLNWWSCALKRHLES